MLLLFQRFFGALLLVYCFITAAYGQATLKGVITNEMGSPVSGASVVASSAKDGPPLAFALSNAEGAYSLVIPAVAGKEYVLLTVAHLSYAKQEQAISITQKEVNWTLVTEVYELPEMEVRQQAVIRKGDTLIFDVNQLREEQDVNLEQVLSRIPGITIEGGGQILYQDLPISKFYIEGLDLLEGRYALATRNLSIDAIRDIEVLEEHQPIRALDSLIKPPNAAINLRLKSQVVFTGEAKAGGGFSPALYEVLGNVFGFQKKQQFNVLGAANNVGEQQRNNFKDLYAAPELNQNISNPTTALPPYEPPSNNVFDNRERSGGVNYLRKLGEYSEFKYQINGAWDLLSLQGVNELTLNAEGGATRFIEQLNAQEFTELINSRIIYELNRPRFYAKTSLEAETGEVQTVADNVINEVDSREDFVSRTNIKLKGRGELIRRSNRSKNAYRLWTSVDFTDRSIDFALLPLDVYVNELPVQQLAEAVQLANEQKLRTDTYTSLIFGRNQLKAQWRGGLRSSSHQLKSDLARVAADGNRETLGDLFQNEVSSTFFAPYLEQFYSWRRPKGKWEIQLPFTLHQLSLVDDLRGMRLNRGLPVFRPSIEYAQTANSNRLWSAILKFTRDYNQDQLFYAGYLLRQNRQFDRQAFAVDQRSIYELNVRLQGNHLTLLNYVTSVNLSHTTAELLANTVFDSLGQASFLVANRNSRQRISWKNQVEITPKSALRFKLNTDLVYSVFPANLNGELTNVANLRMVLDPRFSFSFNRSVLSFRPTFTYFQNRLAESPVWQTRLKGVYFYKFAKQWGKANLTFEHYRTKIGDRVVTNQLLNIWYKNTLPALKLDISLHLNNLTGAADFVTFNQTGFSEALSLYSLRPRQLLLSLARKF